MYVTGGTPATHTMTTDTLDDEIATVAPFANTDETTGTYAGEVDA